MAQQATANPSTLLGIQALFQTSVPKIRDTRHGVSPLPGVRFLRPRRRPSLAAYREGRRRSACWLNPDSRSAVQAGAREKEGSRPSAGRRRATRPPQRDVVTRLQRLAQADWWSAGESDCNPTKNACRRIGIVKLGLGIVHCEIEV